MRFVSKDRQSVRLQYPSCREVKRWRSTLVSQRTVHWSWIDENWENITSYSSTLTHGLELMWCCQMWYHVQFVWNSALVPFHTAYVLVDVCSKCIRIHRRAASRSPPHLCCPARIHRDTCQNLCYIISDHLYWSDTSASTSANVIVVCTNGFAFG